MKKILTPASLLLLVIFSFCEITVAREKFSKVGVKTSGTSYANPRQTQQPTPENIIPAGGTSASPLSDSSGTELLPVLDQQVNSFTLINADTDQDIITLTEGAILNLAALPTKNLNIRANTTTNALDSVVFHLNGANTLNITEINPPYILFGATNGNFNAWVPALGSYTLAGTTYSTVADSDTMGTMLTVNFSVIDEPVTLLNNNAPLASAGADITINFPSSTAVLTGSGTDLEGPVTLYAWSQVSGPSTASFSSKNMAKPIVGGLIVGTYVFSLTVTDSLNVVSKADQVTLVVNTIPVALAGADITLILPANTATLNGSGTDKEGTIASYAWSQVSGPNTATFSSKTMAKPVVSNLIAGSYVFSLVTLDNQNSFSVADQVVVTVVANSLPVASAGVDVLVTLPASMVTLNGSGTDADGTVSSYTWSQVSGPNTAGFSSKTVAKPVVSSLIAGSYVFSLVVKDNRNAISKADQVMVTVSSNNAPVALAGADISIYSPSSTAVLTGAGTDVEGPVALYTWSQVSGPSTASFSNKTVAKPIVGGLVVGSYVFSLIVTDNLNVVSKADQVMVKVISNTIPIASAGADITLTLPTSTATLTGSGTDAEGSISSYGWSQVSGPSTASFSSKTVAKPVVSSLIAGSYVFSLVVKDNQNTVSKADLVTVKVNNAVISGQKLVFTLVNGDTDKDIMTLTTGATLNLATLPTKNLNIRVDADPITVKSVKLALSGRWTVNKTENAPYTLFGDKKTSTGTIDYGGIVFSLGNYSLKATPYATTDGSGTAGTAASINFTVINQAAGAVASANTAALNTNATEPVAATLTGYPNPFQDQVTIQFTLAQADDYKLEVYNLNGDLVSLLKAAKAAAGELIQTTWDARQQKNGIYFVKLTTQNTVQHIRVIRGK